MNECRCCEGFDSLVDDRKHFSEGTTRKFVQKKRHQCRAFVGWGSALGDGLKQKEQERRERRGVEKRESSIAGTTDTYKFFGDLSPG